MAGAMGWSAADVAEASLWQVTAAFEGFRKANGAEDEDGLTDSESDALWDSVANYTPPKVVH